MMLDVHQLGAVWVSITSGTSLGVIPGPQEAGLGAFLTLVDW